MTKSKTRQFRMHEKLLYDVIQRQAGTLSKAALEAVMNSVDAGASRCEISLSDDTMIITDDGHGFPDESSIEKYFETFGQPHEESEKKVYANFRMGRGQLFAFGENLWESGRFTMDVDIRDRGLDYDLEVYDKETFPGCTVTVYLYDPLLPSDIHAVERELAEYCEWIPIPVFLNDREISKNPDDVDWDYESDTAYVKLNSTGQLKVYNLGALVDRVPSHRYGRGGLVVSKKQLKLNFARNQVLENECPIWKEVSAFVKKNADTEIRRKPRLNEDERRMLARRMRYEREELTSSELEEMKVFTDITGRHYSLKQLINASKKYPGFTVPELSGRGTSKRLDAAHQMRLAFVFDSRTLSRFEMDDPVELELLIKLFPSTRLLLGKWSYLRPSSVLESVDTTSTLITEEQDLRPNEKVWLYLLERCGNFSEYDFTIGTHMPSRKFFIGQSECNDGWTDGFSYIAISRNFIQQYPPRDLLSFSAMGHLILHEWCHDAPDTETHDHCTEFYQDFHDNVRCVGFFVENCLRLLEKALEHAGKKMSKQALRAADRHISNKHKLEEFDHQVADAVQE